MNRNIEKRDRSSYSQEELVAEIGSNMLLHDMGYATEQNDIDSKAYVQNWAKAIKCDPSIVEKACRQAVKAANYIYGTKE